MVSLIDSLKFITKRFATKRRNDHLRSRKRAALRLEILECRKLMTTAIASGDWFDPAIWDSGVPTLQSRAIIGHGVTVELDGQNHVAKEVVVHGDLVVPEDSAIPNKSLTTRWVSVNSGGEFIVGTAANRYDVGTFTLELTGTDVTSNHVIEMSQHHPHVHPHTHQHEMHVMANDGFLMTDMGGRVQFYGKDKLSFTKLADSAVAGANTIKVHNVIEWNFNRGAMNGNQFVTSAADDGAMNWEVGDEIVIASSSYDYREEDVRFITAISANTDGTSTLTLNSPLTHKHYGKIETYSAEATPSTPAKTYEIDMRAEVALLSRNVKIKGLDSQDTDVAFGDRENAIYQNRVRSGGLSDAEAAKAPPTQVQNGIGAHIMIMPDSGQTTIDGVQMDGMGQASRKGRYPIHWHLGDDRSGDVLKNSSITNSNNRGVTIHGTSNLSIEGVVLHDIHGHGFFFEDAVETGNVLVGNLALGIHSVGGNDSDWESPGTRDPFVVDTHDSVLETGSRFSSSAAYWITNPDNIFVGNIAAGAGDSRGPGDLERNSPGNAGTGFWFAIPRTALGDSGQKPAYANVNPIFAQIGQFDHNSSHTTSIGLNFDRGTDIEDANFNSNFNFDSVHYGNDYSPRVGGVKAGTDWVNKINGFTNYKATGAAMYHRGRGETNVFNDLRIADSYNAAWAVSETQFNNSLYVGHSQGNADKSEMVGGPRLYDGAGFHSGSHFAGFKEATAFAFQVEGSSFGPTMYHAFADTSFENDGTYGHLAHAVSDFQRKQGDPIAHRLGQPQEWIKAVLDLDGTLTGANKGGPGYSIVPNIDFLTEASDSKPAGWDAWITDDIYGRITISNGDNGNVLFPSQKEGDPLIRFTARDGDHIDVIGGQSNGNYNWTQIVAKTEEDGFVDGTFTVEFGKNGLPTSIFDLTVRNQDGGRPSNNPAIQARVDAARIVVKLVGASNVTPNQGTEVFTEQALRSATSGIVYFRDNKGNLFFNTGIKDSQPTIKLAPGAPLQTAYVARTLQAGTVIQVEEFDKGVESIAYHDTDATNTLGSFRSDTGVDATSTSVGNVINGEWLEYTTKIVNGWYKIGVNVSSSQAGGRIRMLIGENNSAGFFKEITTVDIPNTNGQLSTVSIDPVFLDKFTASTDYVLRLEFDGSFASDFRIDSVRFDPPPQTSYVPRTIAADFNTTRIKLVEFDNGGQNFAYNDTNKGNSRTPAFRPDEDVDNNGDIITDDVYQGEWLEYTTDIHGGLYDITLDKAWGGGTSGLKLFIASENYATQFTQLGLFTFGDPNETLRLNNIDLSPWAGKDRVIRVEIVGNFMGLRSLDFISKSQVAPTVDIVDVTPDPRTTNAGMVSINFDEAVNGFDINDIALTRDGNAVDIGGLALTQVSPKEYRIDLSTVTNTSGNFELKLNSAGSGIADMSGNALVANANDQFMIDMSGPRVESVVINDGSSQRSMVSHLTVTFNEVVNGVDASTFMLTNTTTGTQVTPIVNTQIINGKTVATLTFGGAGILGGSLADGNYTLRTLASKVTDSLGNQLDGNSDGTNGDDAVDSFFRLFGDSNGDRLVNITDFFAFRTAFGSSGNTVFDYNGDGRVNITDFFQFRSRFGRRV